MRLIPNTRQVSSLRFFSFGPDGRGRTYDDFTAAYFTSASYEQRERKQVQRVVAAPTYISSSSGTVEGRVLDPAGAAIAGANITVTDQNGVERVAIANEEGLFRVSRLEAGFYTIRSSSQASRQHSLKTSKCSSQGQRHHGYRELGAS